LLEKWEAKRGASLASGGESTDVKDEASVYEGNVQSEIVRQTVQNSLSRGKKKAVSAGGRMRKDIGACG